MHVPEQRLSKEQKEIRKRLLKRLGEKIDIDYKEMIDMFKGGGCTGPFIGCRKLYCHKDNNTQSLSFEHSRWGHDEFYIFYETPNILMNKDGKGYAYHVHSYCCNVRLSEDNRLYLPIPKENLKRFVEKERIYIDDFVTF